MSIFSIRNGHSRASRCAAVGFEAMAFSATPAVADRITATCATIAGVGDAEANYLYYEAEAEFGAGAAGRLYGAYHQLKGKCQNNPKARVVVSVQPRVKAFFEARR